MTSRGGPAGRARIAAAGALAFVTVIILVLTLTPTGSAGGVESFSFTLRARGFRGLADSLANILLFAPFGAAVAILRPGWLRPILAGAAMSLAIELAQLFVPGRYTSPWDVIFNTAGAAVGVTIVRYAALWLRPSPAVAAALAAAATLTGLTVLLAGPMLFAPATLPGTLVGQWTHVYEDAPRYDGRILEARVGDIPVYAWPVQQSRQLRAAMFRDTVVLKVVAGPPPDGAAPLFGIAAPDEQGLFNLAVSSDDVILGYRMHARRVGLDQPDVRARGILAGIAPGDTFALRTWRHGAGNCIEVRPAAGGGAATSASAAASGASGTSGASGASGAAPGRADGPHTRTFCHAGFTAADTWALLLYPVRRPLDTLLPVLWAAALLFPAGFWARNRIVLAISAMAVLAAPGLAGAAIAWMAGSTGGAASAASAGAVAAAAAATGFPSVPPLVTWSALVGLAAGHIVARRTAGPGMSSAGEDPAVEGSAEEGSAEEGSAGAGTGGASENSAVGSRIPV